MKKLVLFACLIVLIFNTVPAKAAGLDEFAGIQAISTPSGVKVTIAPRIIPPTSLGQIQERWYPYYSYGQGFFYWQGKIRLEGVAVIIWKKQVSNTFGLTWAYDPNTDPDPIEFHWVAERCTDCKPVGK